MSEHKWLTSRRRSIGRLVVLIVVFVPVTIALASAFIAKYLDGNPFNPEPLNIGFGPLVLISIPDAPATDLLIFVMATIGLVVVASLILEGLAQLRVLMPERAQLKDPLPATTAPLSVTVVIPAHNEEQTLPATLHAMTQQTRPPDRIIVVADNCDDNTVQVALECGAEIFETRGNTQRKAGALNQALTPLLSSLTRDDIVMVADADTQLAPVFIEAGLRAFSEDDWDAVGGLFYGEPGSGFIGQLQRNEYARYQLQIRHRRGRVFVLTGTASMFRAEALADVAKARGTLLPGTPGDVYDAQAITEDNEITIALKSLGCRMTSPQECRVVTELMPTWSTLWTQRKRWQRGALENLGEYGITTATARYWGQQLGLGYGVIALTTAYALILITILANVQWQTYPFWLGVTGIFALERGLTVWREGWFGRLLGFTLVFEIAYAFYLQMNFVVSLIDLARRRSQRWGHLNSGKPKEAP